MSASPSLYKSTIIKKIVMACTGIVFFGFVAGHLVGNLKIYMGAAKYDGYAHWLREIGHPALLHNQALWIARGVLIACLAAHAISAWLLYRKSKRARPIAYKKNVDVSFSYASSLMRWGGVILLLFVVFHLAHLTFGVSNPEFTLDSPYANVVDGFRIWWISAIYIIAMFPLGLHIYHGLWSATQTLSLRFPGYKLWRRPLAALVAGIIVLGNISIPVAVLAGFIK